MAAADDDGTEQTITFRAAEALAAQIEASAHLLLILVENAAPRHVPLHLLPLTIGRNAPADVVLEGPTVSRRHWKLEQWTARSC